MAKVDGKDFLEKLVPVLLVLTIGLAFVVGILWQRVSDMQTSVGGGTNVQEGVNEAAQPAEGKLSEDQAKKVPPVTEEDHIKGSLEAKVFIIEYSDFECPFCAKFHPTAQQALEEYGDDIAWVYRHFPLDTLHPRARPAAEASECVADLGGDDAFWEFADYLLENQETALSEDGLVEAASEAGISAANFSECFESGKFEQVIEDDYQEGSTAGVTGTPGNFIMNSKGEAWIIPGAVPFASLQEVIDEALSS
jgi:protein-disulfide isomerase